MMYPPHAGAGGGLPSFFGPLAAIVALLATIFVGPSIWPEIELSVRQNLAMHYSYQTAEWLALAIRIGTYPLCFFILRALLMAALMSLVALTARRLF